MQFMNRSKFTKNVIIGFGGQLLIIILGIIVPRIMLTSYGSDVNGLLGTITQIFTYMALLEAGIGQAARNALYEPILRKDRNEVSSVASAAQSYFRKFTRYYAVGVVLLACVLPFLINTNVEKLTVFLIVILEGLSEVVTFYFTQTKNVVLGVDGRGYINNIISVANRTVSYIVKIAMASAGISIVAVQFGYFIISILKSVFYEYYFKKNYNWLSFNAHCKENVIKDRNAYVLTEITWAIFSSTDMIVLSMFVSTKVSSVYSIYSMVFSNLNALLNVVYHSISYVLGQAYHEDMNKYEKLHDAYTSFFLGTMTVLMSVCYLLITPFVSLYTHGITDVNYIYDSLPIMFCLIQIISWSRYVGGNLTGIAGYAKQTSYISLAEAITNLTLSIILVRKFGIIGVTFATVVALPLKVIWCVYISDKKVMKRSYYKTVKILGCNYLFFFGVVCFSKFYQPMIESYLQFFVWGVLLTGALGVSGMGLNLLVNKDCLKMVKRYVLK